jgi:5-(carboxyamino)imidazole ribonucleotide synthase
MEFHPEANQVEYVICPARIDEKISEKARAIALQVSEKFNRLLAVEMFQTENDDNRERGCSSPAQLRTLFY